MIISLITIYFYIFNQINYNLNYFYIMDFPFNKFDYSINIIIVMISKKNFNHINYSNNFLNYL